MSGRDYRHPWAASVKWPGPSAPRVVEYCGLWLHPSDMELMVAAVRKRADEAERERRREILEALGLDLQPWQRAVVESIPTLRGGEVRRIVDLE
ncbi:hypothetical protein SEA_LITTLETOKYO_68 [Arthrobacter phage LittleTokyo]|nr:hypothetical protein SEA_LITTLETOKYO_68 [Arthrobacter phage LittleTokyo]